tara:strand:- start:31 stop:210 length:180 start_codon:yes stop_codon:yes gene_type:complete
MSSISPISIHNYVAETLGVTKIHEYTLPKTTEQAIKDFREHQRVHNGAWHLGNKLDIMV